MKESLSFCRMCMGHCGVVVKTDEQDQLLEIRGDHDDPQTMGFACFKGLKAVEAAQSDKRVLQPLKKTADGGFEAIPLEQALDEIADKIAAIRAEHGDHSIGGYKGGGGFFTSSSVNMLSSLLAQLNTPKYFSSVTIDQSAKTVAAGRIGVWPAGKDPFAKSDVIMLVGANPLLSVSHNGFDTRNPVKRMKEAKARGMKVIVIDPRETETAKFADIHLQPLPGEDPSILAGLINIILNNDWEDKAFLLDHGGQLAELRVAVAPFTADYVADRAGVPAEDLRAAAQLFAADCKRGAVSSATGPDMSPFCNLSEHLIEALNVVCGRFLREGEEIPNPGVLLPRWPRLAQVMPAERWWDGGFHSRTGYGLIDNELPTGILADEILSPGDDQLRALIVHGGNPASAVPDQHKIVQALESLELLVSIEPFMSTTAMLSDYILPPTLHYERPDLPIYIYESLVTHAPYTRYTEAVAKPPVGSEVYDDQVYFWGLAKRLGVTLHYMDVPLDMERAPTTEEILEIAARHSMIPFAELKAMERGGYVDEPQFVGAPDPSIEARFSLMPEDVAGELQQVLEQPAVVDFKYRMAVRRLRDTLNSASRDLPSIKSRMPYNYAYMSPADMVAEALTDDMNIQVQSDHGAIPAKVRTDDTLRDGVISISQGFGGLPGQAQYEDQGSNTNLLISSDRDRATINAMPRMSGIPVNISRL
jgi:anaerobic selenocysteine-containing dehydrogenase